MCKCVYWWSCCLGWWLGSVQASVYYIGVDVFQVEGAVLVVWSPLLGFQVPIDFNGIRTMGGGKCFSWLMLSFSQTIGDLEFWCFRCTLTESVLHPSGRSGFLMVCPLLKDGLVCDALRLLVWMVFSVDGEYRLLRSTYALRWMVLALLDVLWLRVHYIQVVKVALVWMAFAVSIYIDGQKEVWIFDALHLRMCYIRSVQISIGSYISLLLLLSDGGCTTFKVQKVHLTVWVIERWLSTWCTPLEGELLPSLLVWMVFVVDGEHSLLPCMFALRRRVCYSFPQCFCSALQCTAVVRNASSTFLQCIARVHNGLQCFQNVFAIHCNDPQ